MAHPLPNNLNEACDGALICLAQWVNDVTVGAFWSIILLAFMIVLYASTQRFGQARAFGFSAFIGMGGSILLATAGLMAYWIATLYILAGIIGLATMVLSEK